MINLLGDVWKNGEPDWEGLLCDPRAKIHLYDKGEARAGRKMGHFTLLGDDVDETLELAQAYFNKLSTQ